MSEAISMRKEAPKRKVLLISGFPVVKEFSETEIETLVDIARTLKRHGVRMDPSQYAACFPELFRITGLIEKTLTKVREKPLDSHVRPSVVVKELPADDPEQRRKAELEGDDLALKVVQLVLDTAFRHRTVRHG